MQFDPQSNVTNGSGRSAEGRQAGRPIRHRALPGLLFVLLGSVGALGAYWLDQAFPVQTAHASVDLEALAATHEPVVEHAEPEAVESVSEPVVDAVSEVVEPEPAIAASESPDVIQIRRDRAFDRGRRLMGMGRHTEASECFRTALTHAPDDAEAHYQLGLSYVLTGDQSSAREEIRELETLDPSLASLLRSLVR
ncbi:MAG: tetratricopeptide repeat protein [Planctomycetota bacterium]